MHRGFSLSAGDDNRSVEVFFRRRKYDEAQQLVTVDIPSTINHKLQKDIGDVVDKTKGKQKNDAA